MYDSTNYRESEWNVPLPPNDWGGSGRTRLLQSNFFLTFSKKHENKDNYSGKAWPVAAEGPFCWIQNLLSLILWGRLQIWQWQQRNECRSTAGSPLNLCMHVCTLIQKVGQASVPLETNCNSLVHWVSEASVQITSIRLEPVNRTKWIQFT